MSVFGLDIQFAIGDDTDGDSVRRFTTAMDRFGVNLEDFGQFVFPKVMKLFEEEISGQFESRGARGVAGGWPELSPGYAQWKAVHFPGMPLLEATGSMRAALTESGSTHARREINPSDMTFGTVGVEYFSFHQMGTPFMPARAPVDFGNEFEGGLNKALQLGVVEASQAAGLEVEP